MNAKKILAAVMALTMAASFSACKGDKEEGTTNPTVTGGAAEDVFDLSQLAENGEDVTIDSGMIDKDSGKVTTTKAENTTKPNIKNETTVSGNLAGSNTEKGYKLSWKAVDGAKKYNIYRADTKDGSYKFLGSTTATTYVDTTGSNKYFYKITVASDATSNKVSTTAAASTGFKGSTIQFTGQDAAGNSKQVFISTNLNNTYIAYVRNEYAKRGVNCPAGRLAYVQVQDSTALYVFQFDNTKTWNGNTVEQVHIFETETGTSAYFSFFTKTEESPEYLAARAEAIKNWEKNNSGENAVKYEEMEAFFLLTANHEKFQEIINASY